MKFLSLIIAVLPVVLIALYIYQKDKIKESKQLLFQLFLFGIFSCFPAATFGSILSEFFPDIKYMNFIQLFLYSFIVVALIEELCKWFFTYKLTYKHKEFDSLYDMIVYAVFISLGFAFLENILYVLEYGIVTGILRGILSVPGHACDGVLMGMYLGLAKISEIKNDLSKSRRYKILSILVPTIIHGIFDYCLFLNNNIFIIIFLLFVIVVDIVCIRNVINISKNNYKFIYSNSFCTRCGNRITSKYCTRCGNKNI